VLSKQNMLFCVVKQTFCAAEFDLYKAIENGKVREEKMRENCCENLESTHFLLSMTVSWSTVFVV
jgi:hypothetical protein